VFLTDLVHEEVIGLLYLDELIVGVVSLDGCERRDATVLVEVLEYGLEYLAILWGQKELTSDALLCYRRKVTVLDDPTYQ
jgi:hypothetical protein